MKKFIAFLICISMVLSVSTTSFATKITSSSDEYTCNTTDDYSEYTHYTIDLSAKRSNSLESITSATSYVKSLDLGKKGYGYIEDACLAELKSYMDSGVKIVSYTVLVPNTTSDNVFGTYNGRTYYWDTTSLAVVEYSKRSSTPSTQQLANWMAGSLYAMIAFSTLLYSIPYTLVLSIANLPSNITVSYGSYFQYYFVTSPVTRTIYTYSSPSSTTKKVVYVDQRGLTNPSIDFHPVSSSMPNTVTVIQQYNKSVKTQFYDDTSYILQRCNVMYSHNSTEYWFLSTALLNDYWQ